MIYDIIGDIHGQADKLQGLLSQLGYQHDGTSHIAPPNHMAIFVGDLIDRGQLQLETLSIVFDMLDNHQALAVMGNHEYNAIGYASTDQAGKQIYTPTPRQNEVHQAFLDAVGEGSPRHRYWLSRFFELPLWLEFDEFIVVHACYDARAIQALTPHLYNGRLSQNNFEKLPKETRHHILKLLAGLQTTLPNDIYIKDSMGHLRQDIRIRWWENDLKQPIVKLSAASNCDISDLPDDLVCPIDFYLGTTKPIIIGHYWLTGEPLPLSSQVVCTDYSAGKDGYLTAYQFDTDNPTISLNNFVQFIG
ncbi:metallophosphoesterase [Moraxella sp. ZY200743]|uniref:metallophosphoesterase n=1 Tax=Moraxella sp. ZY200743 TaxID=2911970 RepID=UPI003D7EE253